MSIAVYEFWNKISNPIYLPENYPHGRCMTNETKGRRSSKSAMRRRTPPDSIRACSEVRDFPEFPKKQNAAYKTDQQPGVLNFAEPPASRQSRCHVKEIQESTSERPD